MRFEKLLKQYDYNIPPELIAQKPNRPRDSARLLIYDRKQNKIFYDKFFNIGEYLPKNSILVLNQTKVIPARFIVTKSTGGKAELLYLAHNNNYIKCLSNKKLKPGSTLALYGNQKLKHKFLIAKQSNQFYFLKPNFSINQITAILQKFGKTPLPPYIKNSPLSEKQRREEYQTVFAKTGLSIAAPTASLHFTKKLLAKLKRQGIAVKFVNLNVNLGTFAPLTQEKIKTGKLHKEDFCIPPTVARFLNQAKKQSRPIIPVGTTAVRTLESSVLKKKIAKLKGQTKIFIKPGYKFKFADGLITNFHVPKSSLMMLVAALIGRKKLLTLYKLAIKKALNFFSFGDAMLIR